MEICVRSRPLLAEDRGSDTSAFTGFCWGEPRRICRRLQTSIRRDMSKAANRFAPGVRAHAARPVSDHGKEHPPHGGNLGRSRTLTDINI